MTPFACSAVLLGIPVVALCIQGGIRFVPRAWRFLKQLRRIAEASAWGWEL